MATRAKELSDLGNLKLDVTANGIDVVGVGSNFKSESYNILNVQTDTDDSGSSDDGIFKITNGSAGTTKAEFRWDESEDLVHVSYGDHGRHISIGSDGKVGIATGSTAPSQTLDVNGTAIAEQYLLDAIDKDISITASDVFIYDTSKDSDGGAWRKRTQHTSWYSETLNTATRGSRKEFPSVAIIVCEEDKVTIYDGDDPDMPMWMVCTTSSNSFWIRSGAANRHAVALNGIMMVGTNGGAIANSLLSRMDFLRDRVERHFDGGVHQIDDHGIIKRNNAFAITINGTQNLISRYVNDVAITVLTNPPIDSATGLPVPTIAVATDSGVSVIKDDGTVVDITVNNASYTNARRVNFLSDNSLGMGIGVANGVAQESYYIFNNIPTSDNVITVDNIAGTVQNVDEFYAIQPPNSLVDLQLLGLDTNRALRSSTGNSFASDEGLSVISRNVGAPDKGLISYIASDYNTGYMLGDIKLAALSDTDDTDVTGGNEITNGDAWSGASSSQSSTAPTGWTGEGGATWATQSGGDGSYIRLYNENNGGAGPNSYMHQTITTVVGKKYTISATQYHHATITVYLSVGTGAGVGNLLNIQYNSSSSDTPKELQGTFTATGTTTYINLGVVTGTHNYSVGWDNIVVTESEQDRSVNRNGLQVFGTVTKSAVATGADLVAYSGFSASNFLEQPYFSELNAGTGGYSITFWAKNDGTVGHVACRGTADADESMRIYYDTSNYGIYFDYGVGAPYCYLTNSTDRAVANNGYWHQVVVHVSAGGPGHIYLDGKRMPVTVAGNAVSTIPNDTDYKLRIGAGYGSLGSAGAPFAGSIALFRYSLTIPTDEQIKKIYNDEKHLFQENAKATLYGTSDSVTALAYDDSTELLHVGTSAGRSVFQGLHRVDNTTDAVGAAISASNGLVAED